MNLPIDAETRTPPFVRPRYAELERAYRFLFRDWLAESGREPADHACFEEYLNDARTLPPSEWLTRIYLPLVE